MNRFFSNNIVWKTVSIIAALLLWVFVINIKNPMQSYDVKNKTMSIKGTDLLEEKGYVIKNEEELLNQKISVVVKGPRLQIENIKKDSDLISVEIDITRHANNLDTNMDMVAPVIPLDISVPLGLTVIEQNPQNVEVILEKEKTVSKKIEYTITGATSDEYQTLTPKIVPKEIEVWGAESRMSEVETVKVDINVEDFSEDILTYKIPIKIYDSEGKEITQLKKSHEEAEVTLPIGKKKTVPLEMQLTGKLPEGLVQTGISVQPEKITIIGKADIIDGIDSIKLEEISLDNIIQTSEINTKFTLPKGVSYLDKIDNNVLVIIKIKEQSVYDFSLDAEKLNWQVKNTRENISYEILSKDIKVRLKSIAEELLSVDQNEIKANIDIDKYSEGEHNIPIKFEFPATMELEDSPRVLVKITDNTVEEAEEEVQDPQIPGPPEEEEEEIQVETETLEETN